jgi:putative flippase GtrA
MLTNLRQLWLHKKLRYLAIGAWNTLVGYAVFAVLYLIFGQSIDYLLIALISHLIAVTQSFISQRYLVFRSSGNLWAEYLRFHLAHLGSLVLGLGALRILVENCLISPLTAQVIVTALIVTASYFVHQHFTFRKVSDV